MTDKKMKDKAKYSTTKKKTDTRNKNMNSMRVCHS